MDQLGAKRPIDCRASGYLSLLKQLRGAHVSIFGLQRVFRQQAKGAYFAQRKKSLESCGTQPGISRYIFVCTWLTQNIEHKGPKGSISRKVALLSNNCSHSHI